MTDQLMTVHQYRQALDADRAAALDLLRLRALVRSQEIEILTEKRLMLISAIRQLRTSHHPRRAAALAEAEVEAIRVIPLLDQARQAEAHWRHQREHGHESSAA